ncbi:Sigma factor RpoE negative regulatory protein RseA [Rubrivivax sp. A210]|uniref:sigma-E factor negative regulatory protein n=1 Tax=Rubrivivax sp. A210 TaxID=2772301 RepID=UPI001917C6F8|nr:sigma-E factor negative regulatory protein [Rubrivivax sp. A210]CAD5370657.1 Sigma factor RpoE negative regulatory protein RseA [Rubrivivax sp. A210]
MKSTPKSQTTTADAPHEVIPAGEDRQLLSALADGEAAALQRACALWKGDAQARQTWHAYHLIGDVMRSEELSSSPARDAAFLEALRGRLAKEPVFIAPAEAGVVLVNRGAAAPRRQRWLLPLAAAAGFVAVAGVLVVVRMAGSEGQGVAPTMAAAPPSGATLVSADAQRAPTLPNAGGATVIRDPRLDEFLRAHQWARGGMAVAAPGGALRRVEAVGNPVVDR